MLKLALVLSYAANMSAVTHAQEAVQTFSAAGLRALIVETTGGDIQVEAATTKEILVHLEKQDPLLCEITLKRDGDKLVARAANKRNEGALKWFRWSRGSSCPTGFHLQAPKHVLLEASSGSGEIRITGLESKLILNAGSGQASLSDVSGDLTARLGSGGLRGNSSSKQVDILSGSGDVRLEGLAGSVDLKIGSGRTKLEWSKSPEEGEADVKAGSGDVTLLFPGDIKLRAQVTTGSGRVEDEVGDTSSAKFRVSVKSGSGDVRIGKTKK